MERTMKSNQDQKSSLSSAMMHKQILEIKKKIQLSEGQRKAAFEDCEAERKSNVDEILKLKKEVSQLAIQLRDAKSATANLGHTKKRIETLVGPIDEKTTHDIYELLDLQKTDKLKYLNLLNYKTKQRQRYLTKLAEEYRILLSDQAQQQIIKNVDKPVKKATRELQNAIHAVEVQLREANHVCARYNDIKRSLQDDSARFESNIKKIEEQLQAQSQDINRLQEVVNEATKMRATVRNHLLQEEKAAMATANSRERQSTEGRRLVNSRRQELELLEKRIFQSGKSARTGREVQEDAAPITDDESPESPSQPGDTMAEIFEMLKQATGGTSTEEVLARFNYQKETHERLLLLRKKSEIEKKQLEKRLESLNSQLEHYKFVEAKEAERKSVEVERLQEMIENECKRSQNYNALKEAVRKSMRTILTGLQELHFCINPLTVPDNNLLNILPKIRQELQQMLNKLMTVENGEKDLEQKDQELLLIDATTDDKWLPSPYSGLIRKTPLPQQGSSPAPPPPPGSEDEEDVPSRVYLKRQAQLVVDAKSRRKNIRMQMKKI